MNMATKITLTGIAALGAIALLLRLDKNQMREKLPEKHPHHPSNGRPLRVDL